MNRITCITAAAAVAGVAVAMFGGEREARADVALAADFDIGIPVDQAPQRYLSTGAGLDVRLGYRFRIPYAAIAIVPELAGGYTDLGAHLVRVRPGLRIGIGRLLVPYAYGHVGWAWTSFDPLGSRDASPSTPFVSAQGASFDFGGGLDITILRRLTVGAHIGYNIVDVGTTTRPTLDWRSKWMSLGLNATFYL
jgi:hypothetical protein